MNTTKILFFVILFGLPVFSHAQAPDTLWTRHYGEVGFDEGWQVKNTPDGGYIIVGNTETNYSIYLLKTDENGDTLWTTLIDLAFNSFGYSVEPLENSGYVVAGASGTYSVLIRTDSLGNFLWYRYLGTGAARSVRVTGDGNFIVAGYSRVGGITEDIFIALIDSNGDSIWTRNYGGPENERAWDVHETPDGGFVVAGWTESFGAGGSDIYVLKTDSGGDTVWTRTYGYSPNDEARSVVVKEDGGFILAGKLNPPPGGNRVAVLNLDANGDTVWTRTYSSPALNTNSICNTSDGGYVLTGMGFFVNSFYSSFVMKINADGDSLWTKTLIDSTFSLYCRSIVQSGDGGYVVAGYHYVQGNSNDVFLCKLAPDIVGVDEELAPLPENITLHQNYPNPFNASTTISFELPELQNVNLTIYDLLGRKVEVLLDEPLNAGTHQVIFNADDYSSGLYFYRLETDNYSDSRIMVLIK